MKKINLLHGMLMASFALALAGCGLGAPVAPMAAVSDGAADSALQAQALLDAATASGAPLSPALQGQALGLAQQANTLLDAAAAAAPVRQMPSPPGRPGQWLLFANHEHTSFSPDADESVANLIGILHNSGIDASDLTDHNSMGGMLTPAFLTSPLIMLKGMEWGALREKGESVQGHAGLLDMDGTDPLPTNATLDEMLAMAQARHAYIIANHPFCRNNAWSSPVLQPEVSAIEVWNGFWALTGPLIHNDKAKDWWESAVKQGRHVTAIGGADYHGVWWKHFPSVPGSEPMRPVNLLFAASRTPQGVLDGIRAGHITIEATNQAARVVLEADPAGDGSWSTIEGDEIQVQKIGLVPMRAHVMGGKGLTVEFYGKGGAKGAKVVTSDDAFVPVAVPGVPGVSDYVRVELKAHPGKSWSMTALTNPIYLN